MKPAELGQHREKVEHREFIGSDDQPALLQLAKFSQGFGGFRAQVDQLFGVFVKDLARVGQNSLARGAIKQRFPEFALQLANGLADRRLCAKKLVRSARKAMLAGDRQENFELRKVHRESLNNFRTL